MFLVVHPIFICSPSPPFLPLLPYSFCSLDTTSNLLYTVFLPSFFIASLWPTNLLYIVLVFVVYLMPTQWFPLSSLLSSIYAGAQSPCPCLEY